MADLLALADDDARARWDGLGLGYTEAPGDPLLRTEIASLYATLEADDILVFCGAEEAIFGLFSTILRSRRSRRRDLAGLPEPVRGGSCRRRRRHPPRAVRGGRVGARRRTPGCEPAPDDTGGRRQRAAQPHGDAPLARRVAGSRRGVSRGRHPPRRRRGVSPPGARRPGAAARRRRPGPGVRLDWRAVEVVRPRRPADRMAGVARSRRAGPLRGLQGLHDDLCGGSLGGPGPMALRAREAVLARSRAIVEPNRARFAAFLVERPGFASWVLPAAGLVGFPRLAADLDADRPRPTWSGRRECSCSPEAPRHAGNHVRVGWGGWTSRSRWHGSPTTSDGHPPLR